MIVTDDFIFLHFPKNGGTFVRSNIENAYKKQPSKIYYFMQTIQERGHIPYSKIPNCFNNRQIIAIKRNPYDRYVSQFRYGEWWRWPKQADKQWLKNFKNIPKDVRFNQWIKRESSHQTIQFLKFFSNRPNIAVSMYRKNPDDFIKNKTYKDFIPNIKWLRNENLNRDLADYLMKIGFSESDVDHIIQCGKIKPPDDLKLRKKRDTWQNFFKPPLKKYIRNRDALLFEIFPEYDI